MPELIAKTELKKLNENTHCNDNSKAVPQGETGYNWLHKWHPTINAFNSPIKEIYVSSAVTAGDESIVPFQGCLSIKRTCPQSPSGAGTTLGGRLTQELTF